MSTYILRAVVDLFRRDRTDAREGLTDRQNGKQNGRTEYYNVTSKTWQVASTCIPEITALRNSPFAFRLFRSLSDFRAAFVI